MHISELADHKVESPEEVVKVGDEIEVKILRVDAADRKIGLSRKRLHWTEEQQEEAAEEEAGSQAGQPAGARAARRHRLRYAASCSPCRKRRGAMTVGVVGHVRRKASGRK